MPYTTTKPTQTYASYAPVAASVPAAAAPLPAAPPAPSSNYAPVVVTTTAPPALVEPIKGTYLRVILYRKKNYSLIEKKLC